MSSLQKQGGNIKIKYESKQFSNKTLTTIQQAGDIINEYLAQGFSLTLRQLYYQFVTRSLIPNTEQSYKRIGNIISDARRAGMIDWNSIEDRTRYLRQRSSWDTPEGILKSAHDSYHRDLWENQSVCVEVWIEKDALIGIISDICQTLDVPYFSCRGYVSDSEMWMAGRRVKRNSRDEKKTIILHLGDHDPSGLDMTRDIRDRIELFSEYANFTIKRIALTMEQIEEQQPPPNPAKMTDSRFESYAAKYGYESWELDALEPSFIANLIEEEILTVRSAYLWAEANRIQEEERRQIREVIDVWKERYS